MKNFKNAIINLKSNPMKKISTILLSFLFMYCFNLHATLGYLSYSTMNVGDHIQAIAAKQFLPPDSINIDRDFMSEFTHHRPVKTTINGWLIHSKDVYWERWDVKPPEKSWPPSPSIEPFLISIHLTGDFLPEAFTEEGIAYFKKHAPVGARDYFTLEELQKRGIPSYFSGCLTLTLNNPYEEREDIIYAVDIEPECVEYIRKRTSNKVVVITHGNGILSLLDNKRRLEYTEKLLEKYRKAKCVITSRLHAALPCLAFETPVLFLGPANAPRFDGLVELMHNCLNHELLSEQVEYDFENPPENPKTYLPIREDLIKRMTDWVNENTST